MAPRHGWRMGASLRGAANGGLAAGAGWQGQGAAPRPKRPASGACGLPLALPCARRGRRAALLGALNVCFVPKVAELPRHRGLSQRTHK